jgi:hypothetical protein
LGELLHCPKVGIVHRPFLHGQRKSQEKKNRTDRSIANGG